MAKRRAVHGVYTSSRAVYKAVKKYDHQQFDEFCTKVYTEGFHAGLERPMEGLELSVNLEDVLKVIRDVKGIGPALAGKIRAAIENMAVENKEDTGQE